MDLHSLSTQEVLDKISRHCPEAMWVYLLCTNHADRKGTIWFSRDAIEIDMSECWTKFRNKIKKLAVEGLLEWHPFNNGISVTLAAIDEND